MGELKKHNIKVYIKGIGFGTLISDGLTTVRVTRSGWANGFTDLPQNRVIILYPGCSIKLLKIEELLENYN